MLDRLIDPPRLVAIRANRGMTLKDLARTSGVSYTLLRYVQKGERELSDVTAVKVARALECAVEDFTVPKPRAEDQAEDQARDGAA